MDLAYWGFRHWPFERSYAMDRFFASSLHDEASARLMFLVEEYRRSGIVMGPAGTGKTFLLRRMQERANRLGRITVRCDATGMTGQELAGQIATGCRVPCDADATNARIWSGLNSRFAALAVVQQPIVVMIDHFDMVEFSCQQVVCRLHQLADSVGAKLTVVIATRHRTVPAALQDVIELRIEIAPWTLLECSRFIKTSVVQAGSSESLFADEAIDSLYNLSKGVPANLVTLCHLSLLAAMGQEETRVTQAIVEAVSSEVAPRTGDPISRTRLSNERPVLANASR